MPPRIPVPSHLSVSTLCFRPAPKSHLPLTASLNASTLAQRRKHRDPYALAQAKQRKDANLSRQAELREEREVALGDPVRGITTPFVESFDTVGDSAVILDTTPSEDPSKGIEIKSANDVLLNHFLSPSELETSIKQSYSLTEPVPSVIRAYQDPAIEAQEKQKHIEGHQRAVVALTRITSLANASQKEKTRANIRRCVQTFGRHQTDGVLKPRAPTNPDVLGAKQAEKTPRAGPDTGSSEVQIAILTAKIRVMADALDDKKGRKDKINKRNLRILVHKRQKLLNYLRTKERGSERWQHLVETLGLSEGTWKGEISL